MGTLRSFREALASAVVCVSFLVGCNQPGAISAKSGGTSSSATTTTEEEKGTPGGQASLTIACGSAGICNATNTEWSLGKTGQLTANRVTWTVAPAKGEESHAILTFDGNLTVTNTGSANATIGNIVVNLQRKSGKNQVTAASVVADATAGDAAVTANICSGASSEKLSRFAENGASGLLEFRDEVSNTVFSLVPQKALAPGQTVVLGYAAKYDATMLGIYEGEIVRLEAIVSFGNAGGRGGSGAVCLNVDSNGNGKLEPDESYVRSVPCRTTVTIPTLERSNSSVAVADDPASLSFTGSLVLQNVATDIGGGTGAELTSDSLQRLFVADVDPGTDGGTITNCASLNAFPAPVCNSPFSLQRCDTQSIAGVAPKPVGFEAGNFCGYTQGGWGSKPNGYNPGSILAAGFSAIYLTGVEVGILGTAGFSMRFTSAAAVDKYLPAGKTAGALTSDLANPTSSSAGVFGGQVLALRLNLDFGAAGAIGGTDGPVGKLILQNTDAALDGKTVQEVLALANTALGGGPLLEGTSYPSLNDVVTKLNEAFDNCSPSTWAQSHLRRP